MLFFPFLSIEQRLTTTAVLRNSQQQKHNGNNKPDTKKGDGVCLRAYPGATRGKCNDNASFFFIFPLVNGQKWEFFANTAFCQRKRSKGEEKQSQPALRSLALAPTPPPPTTTAQLHPIPLQYFKK